MGRFILLSYSGTCLITQHWPLAWGRTYHSCLFSLMQGIIGCVSACRAFAAYTAIVRDCTALHDFWPEAAKGRRILHPHASLCHKKYASMSFLILALLCTSQPRLTLAAAIKRFACNR